ncbi:hypothetical protein ASZ90_000618 [hydrocarbon metagenome]|uniref:Uncharacterized protein n=1 Tax=hydrocarbon metagenome TaxID=938273 RepID=A0A0W8G8Z8_9ZZZZ
MSRRTRPPDNGERNSRQMMRDVPARFFFHDFITKAPSSPGYDAPVAHAPRP